MCPSPVPDGYVRGSIFYDGGADDSVYTEYARYAFWNLAGGYGARIIVLTANKDVTGLDYGFAAAFEALEAAAVRLIVIGDRACGHDAEVLQAIQRSTAVFLSGGHPLHWSTRIGGTPLATAIRRANATGKTIGAVGGSAAFLGNHMLIYEEEVGGFPRMAAGLGLSNRILVAGHFNPSRHAELLRMAVASNPYVLGIGLPETAAFIRRADSTLEVVGLASVLLVDGHDMVETNLARWRPGMSFHVDGLRVVELPPEHRYDLERRQLLPPELPLPLPVRSTL